MTFPFQPMTHHNTNNHFQHMSHLPSPFTIFTPALLTQVNATFWDYNNTKFSFPEISHRSEHFGNINHQSQELIRQYFHVPENYHVVYLPNEAGFAAVPFNLNRFVNNCAVYVVDDQESQFAYREALKINERTVKIDSLEERKAAVSTLSEKPYYFYTYYNKISLETGKVHPEPQELEGEILVCNLNYCSHYQQINVNKHGVIFFESGRGFGLTGMTVVIVRKDLVGFQLDTCPDMMCFEKSVTTKSIINTPYTLVPLLFAEYLRYYQKEGKSLGKVKEGLKKIKEEYVSALSKKTEVVETESVGIIKIKIPSEFHQQKWAQVGWRFGDYLIIMLQQSNQGKGQEFASFLFS